MFDDLQLQQKRTGVWVDYLDSIICFDPSHSGGQISGLLVQKKALIKFLKKNRLRIVWTVLGEKQILDQRMSGRSDRSWLELSGVYSLNGDSIDGTVRPLVRDLKNA